MSQIERPWGKFKLQRTVMRFTTDNNAMRTLVNGTVRMTTESGWSEDCLIYVVAGKTESLLGLKDSWRLGNLQISVKVNLSSQVKPLRPLPDVRIQELRKVMDKEQGKINAKMEEIVG